MKVLELQSVKREDFGLYYRKNYTAIAVMEIVTKTVQVPVSFVIETSPLGTKELDIDIAKEVDINYPMLPIMTGLKTYILEMEKQGALP